MVGLTAWHGRQSLRTLAPAAHRYATATYRPLRVTLWLLPGSTLAGNDPLHLDNLLARRVLDRHDDGRGPLDDVAGGYEFPLPLRTLWRSDDGLPLYAATPFTPVGTTASDVTFLHKRQQSGRWTKAGRGGWNPRQGSGRWAERRQAIRSTLAEAWIADAIGGADAIGDLLLDVVHVGKKRAMGFGAVARWEIAPLPAWHFVRGGVLTRPLPALAAPTLLGIHTPAGEPALVGWTPPPWKPSLFRPGWWAGTPVPDVETLAC